MRKQENIVSETVFNFINCIKREYLRKYIPNEFLFHISHIIMRTCDVTYKIKKVTADIFKLVGHPQDAITSLYIVLTVSKSDLLNSQQIFLFKT